MKKSSRELARRSNAVCGLCDARVYGANLKQAKKRHSRRFRSRRLWHIGFLSRATGGHFGLIRSAKTPAQSQSDLTGTFANYMRAIEPLYLGIFAKSLVIAGPHHGVCLVIGFPVALAIAFASPKMKAWLLLLIMPVLDESADPHVRVDRRAA